MSAAPLRTVLALNRTVGIVLVSVLFFGLGEQLWAPFLPAYLEAKTSGGGAGPDERLRRPLRNILETHAGLFDSMRKQVENINRSG